MSKARMTRPDVSEYAPYYEGYISLVPDEDIISALEQQTEATLSLLRGVPESRADHRYEPGKWSIKELVGHVADSERIFAYRLLRFSRGDQTNLPGFNQDDYVRNGEFDKRELAEIVEELECVRRSTLHLLKSLSEEAWERRGRANDSDLSVKALAYIITGHERHHMEVLRTRYL